VLLLTYKNMKKTYEMIFHWDKKKMRAALKMYASGEKVTAVARKFGVEYSTIYYWRKKYNITRGDMKSFDRYMESLKPPKPVEPKPYKYQDLLFEERTKGKSYKDYFK